MLQKQERAANGVMTGRIAPARPRDLIEKQTKVPPYPPSGYARTNSGATRRKSLNPDDEKPFATDCRMSPWASISFRAARRLRR